MICGRSPARAVTLLGTESLMKSTPIMNFPKMNACGGQKQSSRQTCSALLCYRPNLVGQSRSRYKPMPRHLPWRGIEVTPVRKTQGALMSTSSLDLCPDSMSPAEQAKRYLDLVYGDRTGVLYAPLGIGPCVTRSGSYGHEKWDLPSPQDWADIHVAPFTGHKAPR